MSILKKKTLEFTRFSTPVIEFGVVKSSIESVFTAKGTLQPLDSKTRENHPSLAAVEGVYRFYTKATLVFESTEEESVRPDETIIDGATYIVYANAGWTNNVISHNRYLLKKKD